MTPDLINGLKISAVGLAGVFAVLIIFYVIVVLLGRIKEPGEEE